jgi:N-acetyl-gamma-glutamyl-phosphate reductase
MIDIGIIGATGYTGLELLRLLGRHPQARIAWLTSESSGGQQLGDVLLPPALGTPPLRLLDQSISPISCSLPHAAQALAAQRAVGAGDRPQRDWLRDAASP